MSLYSLPSQLYEVLIPVDTLLQHAIDVPRFAECCRQCPKYGKSWACPPFSFDVEALWKSYRQVFLCAAKCEIPQEMREIVYRTEELNRVCERICEPLADQVCQRLAQYGENREGSKIINPDGCHLCDDIGCSRTQGLPCRYPQQMTLSIEGLGIDAQWTLKHCFGMELQWGSGGQLAPYYIRMGGVLLP